MALMLFKGNRTYEANVSLMVYCILGSDVALFLYFRREIVGSNGILHVTVLPSFNKHI